MPSYGTFYLSDNSISTISVSTRLAQPWRSVVFYVVAKVFAIARAKRRIVVEGELGNEHWWKLLLPNASTGAVQEVHPHGHLAQRLCTVVYDGPKDAITGFTEDVFAGSDPYAFEGKVWRET
jgi:hypothetical protein